MPERKGYRSDRLRRRRRSVIERSQAWLLYVVAAVVAFVAVLGAWYIAGRWTDEGTGAERRGYVAALELTVPDQTDPVAALLVVQDPAGGDPAVYLVPPDLLLEGPNGEYVFAADAMAGGTLAGDLRRVVDEPIDVVYRLPVTDIGRWAAADKLTVKLDRAVTVGIGGETRVVKDGETVAAADLPDVFAQSGTNRRDAVSLQVALVASALEAAALRPDDVRATLGASPGGASPAASPGLAEVVARVTSGSAQVARFPSDTRTAEGQFAFVPDAEEVMAEITRRAPDYRADVTVRVRNGSGKIGVGEAVVERLSSLDVNLPDPVNADSFSYRQTQILAGPDTLQVARDIRAILGRGVVLDGADLPSKTVVVIVGDDVQATTPQPKDEQ